MEKDKTKTQSSRRSFPMTEEAREIFLKAKAEEKENQRLFGKAYQKNDYVFKWPDGRTFAPDYVTHHFSKMLERYGMPHIRFHELRHSCASLLLNNGCGLKDVQEWMGHSDIQTFRKLRSSRQGVFSGSAWLVASMQLAYAGTGQKQSVREFLFPLLIASYR